MSAFSSVGVLVPDILLPQGCDPARWACIACDQYTSQPEVWEETQTLVGDAPSTLHLVLPEVWLDQAAQRVPRIHQTMRAYAQNVLTRTVHGFVLTERTTQSGSRRGLVLAVDLEEYDYLPGSTSRIRATEGTILSRIPPRMQVRMGALLECPHILMLLDDPQRTLIEPLYEALRGAQPLYDTELMQGCGHLRGWAVTDETLLARAGQALLALDAARGDAPLFAVGDGNHSLASARAAWLELRKTLTPDEARCHPARYALCEVVNLHDESLVFAPIHRLLSGADLPALSSALENAATGEGAPVTLVWAGGERTFRGLPVQVLQPLLDAFLQEHPAEIDYVHGDEAARALGCQPGRCALLLTTLDKFSLFPAIAHGPLPRKAFSMGEANEKRCYYECRLIEYPEIPAFRQEKK